jgi:methylmalonyl-CoA carboxyltransferase large subunit
VTAPEGPVTAPSDHVVAELLATVRTLAERVEHLENELASVRAAVPEPEVPEDVILAVSAAVAAFLGHRARLTAVHYRTGPAWTQQGRAAVQRRDVVHGVR